jgi:hypothetical protein
MPRAHGRTGARVPKIVARLQTCPPSLVSRALMLIKGDWTDADVVRRIDPALVLAEAWNQDRLVRCRERLAAGEEAPAISVVGFRISRRGALYGVSDGNYRTIAAREAGQKIRARISGTHSIIPAEHRLRRDHLWRREGGRWRMADFEPVPEDLQAILMALGVKAIGPDQGELRGPP